MAFASWLRRWLLGGGGKNLVVLGVSLMLGSILLITAQSHLRFSPHYDTSSQVPDLTAVTAFPVGYEVTHAKRHINHVQHFEKHPQVSITMFSVLKDASVTESLRSSPGIMFTVVAVRSWLALNISKVILFGTGSTCKAFMTVEETFRSDTRVVCVEPPCLADASTGAEGVPRMDCIFKQARKIARSDFLMFSNSDLVYFDDIVTAISAVANRVPNPFMVGKRRDYNFTVTDIHEVGELEWLDNLNKKMKRSAIGHPREGIDFMVFPTKNTPKLPPFLVGRIEWDQWTLLQAIGDPSIATVEISEVVFAVHLNHGSFKQSHSRPGTSYNKQLAMFLPHPYVKETKVHHPGTIWLGRLDEVDLNLVATTNAWTLRDVDFFSATIQPPRTHCPDCVLVDNHQSSDLLLYLAHELVFDRRTVILIRVTEKQLEAALIYYCLASAHNVNSILFTTTSSKVYREFKRHRINCHLLPIETGWNKQRSPILLFLDFVAKALYHGYNVLIASLGYLMVQPVEKLLTSPDHDVQHLGAGADLITKLLYLRARGRTHKMIEEAIRWLTTAMTQNVVAAYSWKEERLFGEAVESAIKQSSAHPDTQPQVSTFVSSKIVEYNPDTDTKVTVKMGLGKKDLISSPEEVCRSVGKITVDNKVVVVKSPPSSSQQSQQDT
eukprot:m.171171 g.171171  ORF g.171171 m.171171 type:complete len:665 (-) comp31638_c0_seq1:271-2265(-)